MERGDRVVLASDGLMTLSDQEIAEILNENAIDAPLPDRTAALIQAVEEVDSMGSTLVAAVVASEGLDWISVGDSPLWLFRAGQLSRLNMFGIYDTSEDIIGFGFVACQKYIRSTACHYKEVKNALDLDPKRKGRSFVRLIDGFANYWKHEGEKLLETVESRSQPPTA